MKLAGRKTPQRGFTLVEMLAALGIFLVVTTAAFTLLTSSQKQYQTETQVLNSFQEARLGLDQMVRDINDAGFPPPTYLASGNGGNLFNYLAQTPFAWSAGAGYPVNPCRIGTAGGGTCTTSSDAAPAILISSSKPSRIHSIPLVPRAAQCNGFAINLLAQPSCPVRPIRLQARIPTPLLPPLD